MSAVGKTPIGLKFIRISSHTPKNNLEGIAEIICEDIDILSHPREGTVILFLLIRLVLYQQNTVYILSVNLFWGLKIYKVTSRVR